MIAYILLNFIVGVGLSSVGFALRLGSNTRSAYLNVLRYIFCLLPAFALGDGLYNLGLRDLYTLTERGSSDTYQPFDWEISGANICFLTWTSVVYLVLTVLIEYAGMNQSIQRLFKVSIPPEGINMRDKDVLEEEERVNALDESLGKDKTSILIKNVRGEGDFTGHSQWRVLRPLRYYPITDVLLVIIVTVSERRHQRSGQVNYSVDAEWRVHPHHGGGVNLLEEAQKCRRKIGFCPQFDSILELLTAREHLQLFACIKGTAYMSI